jgi:predicted RNA-binding Zn-ribbon protein involved in translation (DUF1610 family)
MKKKKPAKQKKENKVSAKKEAADFEEVDVVCASCGRTVKVIKVRGMDTDNFICQKCGFGIEKPDEFM